MKSPLTQFQIRISLTTIFFSMAFVGVFTLCYFSKRLIDQHFTKEPWWEENSVLVPWGNIVDWEYLRRTGTPERQLPKTFVYVSTLEEAASQPLGCWIMDPEGRIGQTTRHAERK